MSSYSDATSLPYRAATFEDEDDDDSFDSEQQAHDELSSLLITNHSSIPVSSQQIARRNFIISSELNSQTVARHGIPKGISAVVGPLVKMRDLISHHGLIMTQLVLSLTTWIRAHKRMTAVIVSGIILSALCIAMPAILGAIGFSATGPVLGSVAAGWQASIGSVAAGSLFSFLQSAAMGGAAMGLFTGVGVLGAVVAVGGGLATIQVVKERCGEVMGVATTAVKDGCQNVMAKTGKLWQRLWS